MTRYAGLLRGINVGGNRRLKMADLRDIVAAAGGVDVATYIQSGNVVFTHPARSSARLTDELQERIERATGMAVPVTLRTSKEWDAVVAANPFPDAGPTQLHVVFLTARTSPDAFAAIDLPSLAPEELVVAGRELYLHLPNGMGRAKLPVELERRGPKDVVGTARNWATVTAVHDLLRS